MVAAAKERSAKSKPKCCVPKCTRNEYSRGECKPCFKCACRLVTDGETTWDELVDLKLAKPSRARKPNPLAVAFRAAKAKQAASGKARHNSKSRKSR
jgi:hypothetical protein